MTRRMRTSLAAAVDSIASLAPEQRTRLLALVADVLAQELAGAHLDAAALTALRALEAMTKEPAGKRGEAARADLARLLAALTEA